MTLTATYTRLTTAFVAAATAGELSVMDVRVVLAIADRAGAATSHQLAEDLRCESSLVRRALARLYARSYAIGEGLDGGPRRPGVLTIVRLTRRGAAVAKGVQTTAAARR